MDFETGKGAGERPTGAAMGAVRAPHTGEFEVLDPIRSFGRVVYDIIFEPRTFFRGLRPAGDWMNSFFL